MYFDLLIIFILVVAGVITFFAEKLTLLGAVAGVLIAIILFIAFRLTGIIMLGGFFVMSVLATSAGLSKKIAEGVAESNSSRRTLMQVLANGGIAGFAGFVAILIPSLNSFCLLLCGAALASASADTVSSEIGSVYGRKFFDILSWQPASRGADGAISWLGTFAGVLASIVIALLYVSIGQDSTIVNAATIVVAGTIGNLSDSVLGATFERRQLLNNNVVNFLNTAIAAIAAMLITTILTQFFPSSPWIQLQ